MSSWRDSANRAPLRRDLYSAVRKPLVNVFRDPGGRDHMDYPILAKAVEDLEPGKWREHDYNGALIRAVRRAVELLPDDDGPRDYSTMSWRAIGATLCAFENTDEATDVDTAKAYNRLYEVVRQRSHKSPSRFRAEVASRCFTLLADMLASLEHSQADKAAAGASNVLGFNPLYVARPELHQAFAEHVQAGAKLIAFVGQAGMGKTWLARNLTARDQGEAPRIRVIENKLFAPDVQSALYRLGYEPDSSSATAAQLALLVSDSRRVPFLVLDNLDDTQQLFGIVPTGHESVVVATCRTRNSVPPDCMVIDVGQLSPSEAADMTRLRLSDVADSDIERIGRTFGYHPLLIDYVCVLLRFHKGTVDSFCDAIQGDLSRIGSHTRTEDGQTLVAILERFVAIVSRQDPVVHHLLACLSFLAAYPVISREFMQEIVRAYTGVPLLDYDYAHGLAMLSSFHLVGISRTEADDDAVEMHPLTRATLVFKVFREEAFEVFRCAFKVLNAFRVKHHQASQSWDMEGMKHYYVSKEEDWAITKIAAELVIDREDTAGTYSDTFKWWLADSLRRGTVEGAVDTRPEFPDRWIAWMKSYLGHEQQSVDE